MTTIRRTHDALYLNENRYRKPKQLFTDIMREIERTMQVGGRPLIADFGCAAGEFAYTLHERFPRARVEGYDLLEALVAKARNEVPDARFFVGSILDEALCAPDHADYSVCVGVLSIFDGFEGIIGNLIRWTKPGGHIYLQGLYNPLPLDVNIKYNLSEDYGKNVAEAGWNIFSRASVSVWLEDQNAIASYDFLDFRIDVDLEPQKDPVRSWTFKDESGARHITNGLSIIQPHGILHIHKCQ